MRTIDAKQDSKSIGQLKQTKLQKAVTNNRLGAIWLKDKWALSGFIIVAIAIISSVLAPWLAPYDPYIGENTLRLAPPGTEGHLLGLDGQGRDILSRLIWGGRLSLIAGIVPLLLAAAVSLLLGLLAGYLQGSAGSIIMRTVDILFAFPTILIAMLLATVYKAGMLSIMLTIFIAMIPILTRVVYGAVISEMGKEYIDAARMLGASSWIIITKELLPNVITPLLVYATSLVGKMIIFSAGLSFMGLGIQAPLADWGKMTSEGVSVMLQGAYHVAMLPGFVILIVALGFAWFGDALRNYYDPRYK